MKLPLQIEILNILSGGNCRGHGSALNLAHTDLIWGEASCGPTFTLTTLLSLAQVYRWADFWLRSSTSRTVINLLHF